MVQKRKKPAFGRSAQRFETIGLHPSYERRGYTHKYPHISPGCYYYETERKPKGIGYALSVESEEFSKTLGQKADDKVRANLWYKSINGPGWHEIVAEKDSKPGTFPKALRFPRSTALATPGPGTYKMENPTDFSHSSLPSFEQDNGMPRSKSISRLYHLPPNLYKVKSCTEEILNKIISKRGPYDLFTGSRDETSIYGHQAKIRINPFEKSIDYPDTIERLNDISNKYKGILLKCGRNRHPTTRMVLTDPALCKPDPDQPAPNFYHPKTLSKPSNAKNYPFNSSALHARPIEKVELKPPAGRYEPALKKRIFGSGLRSTFLSRTKRGIPLPEKMSWFP